MKFSSPGINNRLRMTATDLTLINNGRFQAAFFDPIGYGAKFGDNNSQVNKTTYELKDSTKTHTFITDGTLDVNDTSSNLLFQIDAANVVTQIGTSLGLNRRTTSGTDTIGLGDYYLDADTTSVASDLALLAANAIGNKTSLSLVITDMAGNAILNNVTITPNGTDTINGVNAPVVINTAFGSIAMHSDGVSNWIITSRI